MTTAFVNYKCGVIKLRDLDQFSGCFSLDRVIKLQFSACLPLFLSIFFVKHYADIFNLFSCTSRQAEKILFF